MVLRRPWERERDIETKTEKEPKTHTEEMGHSEQAREFSCTKKYSDILKEEIQSR